MSRSADISAATHRNAIVPIRAARNNACETPPLLTLRFELPRARMRADHLQHGLDLSPDVHARGIDHDRVGRLAKRTVLAAAIAVIAPLHLLAHLVESRRYAARLQLAMSTSRTRLEIGLEEDLHLGIGEHHG